MLKWFIMGGTIVYLLASQKKEPAVELIEAAEVNGRIYTMYRVRTSTGRLFCVLLDQDMTAPEDPDVFAQIVDENPGELTVFERCTTMTVDLALEAMENGWDSAGQRFVEQIHGTIDAFDAEEEM